jgi:predicted PurR-regulated permease PerM
MPVAMVLGLITGLLELVPNLGSLLAMIPGVLLALNG